MNGPCTLKMRIDFGLEMANEAPNADNSMLDMCSSIYSLNLRFQWLPPRMAVPPTKSPSQKLSGSIDGILAKQIRDPFQTEVGPSVGFRGS